MEHNREQKKKTEEEYQKLIENEEVCKEKLKELIKKQENIIEQIELARDNNSIFFLSYLAFSFLKFSFNSFKEEEIPSVRNRI